ncbi:DUF3631 domain-containing protein [Acinetobacter baumannii]|uniref:DUF3631 domain-containing protein n=1 Tax=Acinetobacter baumannii TaxID=470 RepID=UPI003FA49A67
MSNLLKPNAQDAWNMQNFLDLNCPFTFQTFADDGSGQYTRTFNGSLLQHFDTLSTLNSLGAGIFVCINETDCKGRKASNIVRIRALFVDFDIPNPNRLEELLKLRLPPNMIIESSPNKHHAYWVLNSGIIDLDEFKPLQQKLATALGGDKSICDRSRVLRMAVFLHKKGTPFLTHIKHLGEHYNADHIKEFVKSLDSDVTSIINHKTSTSSSLAVMEEIPEHIKQAKKRTTRWDSIGTTCPPDDLDEALSHISSNDREIWLKIGMALRNSNLENAYEIWCKWSSRSNKYNLTIQKKTWDTLEGYNGVTLGTVYHLASQKGFKRLRQKSVEGLNTKDVSEPPLNLDPSCVIDDIRKLSKLTAVEYELKRESEAKRLGMRASKLDEFVKTYRKIDQHEDNFFEDVDAWPEPVDGSELLNELEKTIKKYIVAEPSIYTAAALWIMFTWCIDAMKIAPIACITAPEKRCGKSQFLHLIGRLVRRPQTVVNITTASLFRMIAEYTPTVLIDEADTFIKDNEELRGLLNGGYDRQSSYVVRLVGDEHKLKRFNVWGAKALSGIGHLPDTLKDRSILLELRRKKREEKVERLRRAPEEVFDRLRQKLYRWSLDNIEELKEAKPTLPDELNDRAQDNWESLLAIADCVDVKWGEKARKCAILMNSSDQDPQSVGEALLADIKRTFNGRAVDRMSTEDLIEGLCHDLESRWRTYDYGKWISPRQLANRLKAFHIKPCTIRTKKGTCKGYMHEDFTDAFSSYVVD